MDEDYDIDPADWQAEEPEKQKCKYCNNGVVYIEGSPAYACQDCGDDDIEHCEDCDEELNSEGECESCLEENNN